MPKGERFTSSTLKTYRFNVNLGVLGGWQVLDIRYKTPMARECKPEITVDAPRECLQDPYRGTRDPKFREGDKYLDAILTPETIASIRRMRRLPKSIRRNLEQTSQD